MKVHKVGSEIEVQVRDQSIIFWNDIEARQVAEEILKLTEPVKPDTLSVGTMVRISETLPEDWDDTWWPAGELGRITGTFYEPNDKQQCYIVEFDDEESNSKVGPDYYWAEDLEIVRTS